MKFNEELFYQWLLDKSAIKRHTTKRKIAYCMACLLELAIENEGKKIRARYLFERAHINKAALHYAVGGIKNLWAMIRKAISDCEACLSEEQQAIIHRLFSDKSRTGSAQEPVENPIDIRLMDYPAALSLMIRRDYSIYRMSWAGGRVKLHCDKRRRDEHAEFLFISPEGISIAWNPSVQDQLADNWAVYRAR